MWSAGCPLAFPAQPIPCDDGAGAASTRNSGSPQSASQPSGSCPAKNIPQNALAKVNRKGANHGRSPNHSLPLKIHINASPGTPRFHQIGRCPSRPRIAKAAATWSQPDTKCGDARNESRRISAWIARSQHCPGGRLCFLLVAMFYLAKMALAVSSRTCERGSTGEVVVAFRMGA